MGIPVLIIGRSGTGKSTAMRNLVGNANFGLIKAIEKPLPFKGKIPAVTTDDYSKIKGMLKASKAPSMIIDDAGYLITNHFMMNHSASGTGNNVFSMYNQLADDYFQLVQFVVNRLPPKKIIYFIMHEEADEQGNTKPKTIGKLLDEKVCLEGMFTIVLRCMVVNGAHCFITQSDGKSSCKTPMGMFEEPMIDNDLLLVDNTIREYYDIITKVENGNGGN